MTKTLKTKAIKTVKQFQLEHTNQTVSGCCFHHYGNDYRIEEITSNNFTVFLTNKYGILDTKIETFAL